MIESFSLVRDADADDAKKLEAEADAFRTRAKSLRRVSYCLLGFIIALLVGSAAAFIFARQISVSSGTIDLEAKLGKLEAEDTVAQNRYHELQDRRQSVFDLLASIFHEIGRVATDGDTTKPFMNAFPYTKEGWLNVLHHEQDVAPINSPLYQNNFGVVFDSNRLPDIILNIRKAKFPDYTQKDEDDYLKLLQTTLPELGDAEQELQVSIRARDVSGLTGLNAGDQSVDRQKTLTTIISTNLTRFGTVIFIGFLVATLTPLYRWNMRLAAYYEARADALRLMSSSLGKIGFVDLSNALTPNMDFGKTPPTPVDQMVELIKLYAGGRKLED